MTLARSIGASLFTVRRRITAAYIISRVKALVKYGHLADDRQWTIRQTEQTGEGLFTRIPRKKGSVIFVSSGPVHYHEPESPEDYYAHENWYGIGPHVWIGMRHPYVKANHSCHPNMGMDGARIFVALHDIAAGEELVFDYSITQDELGWSMPCRCGHTDCEKVISGIQTMSKERYLRSHPYILSHYRNVFENREHTQTFATSISSITNQRTEVV